MTLSHVCICIRTPLGADPSPRFLLSMFMYYMCLETWTLPTLNMYSIEILFSIDLFIPSVYYTHTLSLAVLYTTHSLL